MDNVKQRIEFLKKQLNEWSKQYYDLDRPTVSDADYDLLLKELTSLEKQYPQYHTDDSPTNKVGGTISAKFTKVKHNINMLSLSNAFNSEELLKFDNDVKEATKLSDISYTVEPKIDGLSISLYYQDGKLVKALTRGDGINGEDVTVNVRTIKSVPLSIDYHGDLQVRGEIFMSYANFEKINNELDELDKFANPRNAAAGSLRNLDSSITAKRNLLMVAYYLPDDHQLQQLNLSKQSQVIERLKSLGFYVAKGIKYCKNIEEVIAHIQYLETNKEQLGFPIDGGVVKVDNLSLYDSIGYTSKFPKWAIAYKFAPEIVQTKLLEINATVGRTGRITYVAKLEPVQLSGSTISAATLHNGEYIIMNDIRVGDIVKVYKAAEIIPKVIGPVLELRKQKLESFKAINVCPVCNATLTKELDEVDQYCPNISCKSRALASIAHFTSKKAMNIMLLSDKTLAKLYDHGVINSVCDIYDFHNKKQEILALDLKLKQKAFTNIVNNINNSKTNSLERLLFALGIRHVGEVMAKSLAKLYRSIDNLANTSYEDLLKVNDIGSVVAKSIVNFFADQNNKQLITKLKSYGVNTTYLSQAAANIDQNNKYYQKTFVITGSFDISRHEIKSLLEKKYDANVVESLSRDVDYLIVGQKPGSKIDKAKKLNIQLIEEAI
jgi:DNA ligase (NAD+)